MEYILLATASVLGWSDDCTRRAHVGHKRCAMRTRVGRFPLLCGKSYKVKPKVWNYNQQPKQRSLTSTIRALAHV